MQMLKAIKYRRLYEDIVAQIYGLIREGTLKPGDKLPPERELAQRFNVSRASVREAIRILGMRGLLVSRPGSGTFVTSDSLEAVIQAFSDLLTDERDSLAGIFEMRLLLEPQVASLASQRASDEDISLMRRILEEQEAQIARGESGAEADSRFHFAIASATQNTALIALSHAVEDILSQSRDPALQSVERSQRSLESHRRIMRGIERRSPEESRKAMHQHISQVDVEVHSLTSSPNTQIAVAGD